jgi:hypothetical protein
VIGKTCCRLGSKIFEYFWKQILGVVLVYDAKIDQLGRKNLAVRFDLDQARWLAHHRPQERWAAEAL